jgi:MFS transporter, PCFT/HCP family, solute carrier family 46, member 3
MATVAMLVDREEIKVHFDSILITNNTIETGENDENDFNDFRTTPIIRSSEIDPFNPVKETEETLKKSCFQKCVIAFQNITVETTILLFVMAYLISMTTIANLNIDKACRVNLNYSDEICTALRQQKLESQNVYEMAVQLLVSTTIAWKALLTGTIPCLLALFIGRWQDKTGHTKIFFLIPITGQILNSVVYILSIYFFYEIDLYMLALFDAIIEALTGGMCIILLTMFIYISAITTEENRTFRMGVVNLCFSFSLPLGTASSGLLLKHFGYLGTFVFIIVLHVINILYNVCILKNPSRTSEHKKVNIQIFIVLIIITKPLLLVFYQ